MLKHFAITDALKASPVTEGDKRFVYVEASNESLDLQGEVMLVKALKDSADYFLKFGNLDLDHLTQIGLIKGNPDYAQFEIGRPVAVEVSAKRAFVKGEIFTGNGPMAAKANEFWDSITNLNPPMRWYPSVGGQITERAQEPDPQRGVRTLIKKVRWTNIGFSKTPVNTAVSEVTTLPIGAFAKAWSVDGLNLKALTAGYATDAADKTGGAALGKQSLDGAPKDYWHFRDRMASAITAKTCNASSPEQLATWAEKTCGLSRPMAAEWTHRFMSDLNTRLNRRTTP